MAQLCVFSARTEAKWHDNKSSGKEIQLHSTFARRKCNFIVVLQEPMEYMQARIPMNCQVYVNQSRLQGACYSTTHMVQNLAFCGVIFFSNGICHGTGAHKQGVPVVGAKKRCN